MHIAWCANKINDRAVNLTHADLPTILYIGRPTTATITAATAASISNGQSCEIPSQLASPAVVFDLVCPEINLAAEDDELILQTHAVVAEEMRSVEVDLQIIVILEICEAYAILLANVALHVFNVHVCEEVLV